MQAPDGGCVTDDCGGGANLGLRNEVGRPTTGFGVRHPGFGRAGVRPFGGSPRHPLVAVRRWGYLYLYPNVVSTGAGLSVDGVNSMATWETCIAVERSKGKVGGAWVFRGTRVPVSALFENLRDGASAEQFLEWFPGVDRQQVETVLDHELRALV